LKLLSYIPFCPASLPVFRALLLPTLDRLIVSNSDKFVRTLLAKNGPGYAQSIFLFHILNEVQGSIHQVKHKDFLIHLPCYTSYIFKIYISLIYSICFLENYVNCKTRQLVIQDDAFVSRHKCQHHKLLRCNSSADCILLNSRNRIIRPSFVTLIQEEIFKILQQKRRCVKQRLSRMFEVSILLYRFLK